MTDDTTRQGDWERKQVEGQGQDPNNPLGHAADQATGDRWTKTQWVGDQGEGSTPPQDPDAMPEGETSISGNRSTGGESDFAGRQERDRT